MGGGWYWHRIVAGGGWMVLAQDSGQWRVDGTGTG